MADQKQQALIELYSRNALSPEQKAVVEELAKRGAINLPVKYSTDAMISQAQREQSLKELAQKENPLSAFAIQFGKGLQDVAAGAGFTKPQDPMEAQATQALAEEYPVSSFIGEVAGQSSPFLPLGGAVGMIESVPARAGASTILGGTEGGVIANATDSENVAGAAGLGGAIAGTVEMVSPTIGRFLRQTFSKLTGRAPKGALVGPDGKPTQELLNALESHGMQWDDLSKDIQDMIGSQRAGASPEEVARLAKFQEVGAQPTAGQLRQDQPGGFEQLKTERQLLESGAEGAADQFRSFAREQLNNVQKYVTEAVDKYGLDAELGQRVKDTLLGRKQTLKSERKALYKELSESLPEVGDVPFAVKPLMDALPDATTMQSIALAVPEKFDALKNWIALFGLDQSDDMAKYIAEKNIKVNPLGLHNFEDFRKGLGRIERSDPTGTISEVIGPIRRALDDEIDNATQGLAAGGGKVGELAKQARKSHIALMTEFDPAKMTSKLIDSVTRGSTKPKVEASQVYMKLTAKSTPIEELQRVMDSLKAAGSDGDAAIGALKSQSVMDLIDSALKGETNKIGGQKVISPTAFVKAYEAMLPKLKVIFKDSPEELKRLSNAQNVLRDMIPPSGAMPKGSAGFIMDALKKTGMYSMMTRYVPGSEFVLGLATKAGREAQEQSIVNKALKVRPASKELAMMIDRDFPQLAAYIGIAGISAEAKDDNNQQ